MWRGKKKDISILAHSTQDQVKGEKQLSDVAEAINFLSDKFKEYGEDSKGRSDN